MTQVGEEDNEEMNKLCENRDGWVNDKVKYVEKIICKQKDS